VKNMDNPKNIQQKPNFNINLDTTPILFSDNIQMKTNNGAVVLDFSQQIMNNEQFKVVSRIGMSRDLAKEFVKLLGNLIIMTEGQLETGKKKN